VFSISVDYEGLKRAVSYLESTLVGWLQVLHLNELAAGLV
jgi:hypothetical protein